MPYRRPVWLQLARWGAYGVYLLTLAFAALCGLFLWAWMNGDLSDFD